MLTAVFLTTLDAASLIHCPLPRRSSRSRTLGVCRSSWRRLSSGVSTTAVGDLQGFGSSHSLTDLLVGKVYGQTSRDMRRLDSVTRSPLYSIYGETIAGVTVLRAFGASTKFMRDMLRCVDTVRAHFFFTSAYLLTFSLRRIRTRTTGCGVVRSGHTKHLVCSI